VGFRLWYPVVVERDRAVEVTLEALRARRVEGEFVDGIAIPVSVDSEESTTKYHVHILLRHNDVICHYMGVVFHDFANDMFYVSTVKRGSCNVMGERVTVK
jgi:hypothetical protein